MRMPVTGDYALLDELGRHLYGHLPAHLHKRSKGAYDRAMREIFNVSGLTRVFVATWRKGHGLVTEAARTEKGIHLRRARKVRGTAGRALSSANDKLMRLVWQASYAEGGQRARLIDAVRYVMNVAQPLLGAIADCRLPANVVRSIVQKVFHQAEAIVSGSRYMPEGRLLKLILRFLNRAEPIAA